jgi:tetratricopeptide (TPR) repeat protein
LHETLPLIGWRVLFFQHVLGLFVAFALSTAAPPDAHLHGVDLYRQQKYAEAIATLEVSAKNESPESLEYRESALLIGQSYFMLSKAPQAIPWLEKLPGVNEANYMLGYAYLQTAQRKESEAAFARLFGLPPDSAAGHLVAGQMMLKKDYDSEALSEVAAALTLDPKIPEAHFLLGEMAIFRGRLDEAIEDLGKEVALNPNFSMAWYRLGDAYTRQQQWELAIPNLQRSVWLNPDFSGPFILLGRCYFKTGNLSNAEGILRKALALDPRNSSATYLLGQTLIAEGKKDEGRTVLGKMKPLKGQ